MANDIKTAKANAVDENLIDRKAPLASDPASLTAEWLRRSADVLSNFERLKEVLESGSAGEAVEAAWTLKALRALAHMTQELPPALNDFMLERIKSGDLSWYSFENRAFIAIPASVVGLINELGPENQGFSSANRTILSPIIRDLAFNPDSPRAEKNRKLLEDNRIQIGKDLPSDLAEQITVRIATENLTSLDNDPEFAELLGSDREVAEKLITPDFISNSTRGLGLLLTRTSSERLLDLIDMTVTMRAHVSGQELVTRETPETYETPSTYDRTASLTDAMASGKPIGTFIRGTLDALGMVQFGAIFLNDIAHELHLPPIARKYLFESLLERRADPDSPGALSDLGLWDVLEAPQFRKTIAVARLVEGNPDRAALFELLLAEDDPAAALASLEPVAPENLIATGADAAEVQTSTHTDLRLELTRLLSDYVESSPREVRRWKKEILGLMAREVVEYQDVVEQITSGVHPDKLIESARVRLPRSSVSTAPSEVESVESEPLNFVFGINRRAEQSFNELPAAVRMGFIEALNNYDRAAPLPAGMKVIVGTKNPMLEVRSHEGPGYRAYFMCATQGAVWILGAGEKGSQKHDIAVADKRAELGTDQTRPVLIN